MADYYVYLYNEGRSEVIVELAAEEANLLHARDLARRNSWFKQVISTMQGLRVLYRERGRRAEWARLVEEIVPDFVDGTNEGPLPGLEEQWSLVTEFRVRILRDAGRLVGAERLQRASVQWDRQRADPALALRAEELDIAQRNMIRMLAASLHDLGQIQRAIGRQECAASYEESYEISLRIKDSAAAAIAAFNLGSAYLSLPALRNLDEAGGWCQRSMELGSEGDRLSCAQCLGQLGDIAKERFLDAAVAGKADLELLGYANAAVSLYLDALNLLPEDSVNDLAVAHNRLGSIYDGTGDLDQALAHYRKSIGYMEKSGNIYGAAHNRYEVAAALARRGRFADAKEYAVAARRGYEAYGEGARKDALITLELIASIEHSLKAEGAGA